MGGLILLIIVGLTAGWMTDKIMNGDRYAPLMDIVLGIIGAFIGDISMTYFGFAGSVYSILVAVVGAVLLTLLLRLAIRNRVVFNDPPE